MLGPERVLYARKHVLPDQKAPVAGGEPVTEALAVALRNAVFGAPAAVPVPRPEWLRTAFTFRPAERELGYGLTGGRSTVRGLLAVVQAHVVRHLLFGVPAPFANSTVMSSGMVHPYHHERLLRPTALEQQDALCVALSAILWRVGERKRCVLTVPQEESYLHPNQIYCPDGVTEKLQIFEVTSLEDLQIVIKRYLYLFQAECGPGALLLLYSAVLTRGLDKVVADMDQAQTSLIGAAEEGSACVVMLLLTGRATPYLHNGVLYVGDEEHYALPRWGVLSRGEVGLLLWDEAREDDAAQPGSRLKTPSLPVWVASGAGHFGLLFSTNRELLRNYHAERRFDLHYYSCNGSHGLLSIDTRYDCEEPREPMVEALASPIEKVILSKWQDAHITWIKSSHAV
ncbi:inactive ubiquitin carboxyl-terminal hydrolase MINDY-4B isoform X2 [Anabrus simplex]|uniref:inactive ubiquitin carboxyl-terminal hydrolase MINDY-4B isoform X2 n=1 Tax=Anabrus simplex TaxID=316456 RepID=UPI0034DD3ECE